MKKFLVVSICILLLSTISQAAMVIEATPKSIDPILEEDGWLGYTLSIVSDDNKVAGFDFANNGGGIFSSFYQNGPALGTISFNDTYFFDTTAYLAWFDTPIELNSYLLGSAVIQVDYRDYSWDFAFIIINADCNIIGMVSDSNAYLYPINFTITYQSNPTIPEPASLSVLAVGLGIILARRRCVA